MNQTYTNAVYVRASWSSAWVLVPYLRADHVTFASAPVISSAKLSWAFGPEIMQADAGTFAPYPPLSLSSYYVKIVIDQAGDDRTWYGVVVDDEREWWGEYGINAESGKQSITAYGLEFLLEREIVGAAAVDPYNEHIIQRGIGFNLGAGQPQNSDYEPNRSGGVGALGTPIYAKSLDDAAEWTAYSAIEYLLAYNGPMDLFGTVKIPFQLAGGFASEGLTFIKPAMPTHGKTVWTLLNELMDRRRLYGFYLDVVDDVVVVQPFTFNAEVIGMSSGGFIPQNPAASWEIINDRTVTSLRIGKSNAHSRQQIICRGERAGSVFTVAYDWSNLEADWDSTLQTAYNTAASGDAGYAALDDYEKQNVNQLYRQQDKFKRVYSYLRIPPTWNGKANGEEVFPEIVPGTGVDKFWYGGMWFENHLPLLTDHDYSGNKIATNTVTDLTKEGSKAEKRRPFAVIYDAETTKYAYTDKIPRGDVYVTHNQETNGLDFSVSLRMQDDALGIILDTASHPQHAIAKQEFTAADATDTLDFKAQLEWQDVFATVYLLRDSWCEGRYPPDSELAGASDAFQPLLIHIPNAHLDYVVPGTVVAIDTAGAKVTSNGGYIRDNRERLEDLAQIAYEWYRTERRPIVAMLRRLDLDVSIGQMLSGIGNEEELNTVVTQIELDFLDGYQTVQTAYAELDVSRL